MSQSSNVHWHHGEVSSDDRLALLKQNTGATVWFTGLSGSGKSTIAVAVEKRLRAEGYLCYRLDGDNIRLGINNNLGFTAADRKENIRRIAEISKLLVDAGVIVLSSFISPYKEDREFCRELHDKASMKFYEIYVDCPLAVAEERDPKGLYKKARSGEIPSFTGISDPYEAPVKPDLHLQSHIHSLDEESNQVVDMLKQYKVI